jgi:hypothetical protein
MQKRIIIIGDSFSLGVGAQFPEIFDQIHPYAPKIDSSWLEEFTTAQRQHFENFNLQRSHHADTDTEQHLKFLCKVYDEWQNKVFNTDIAAKFKEDYPNKDPNKQNLNVGVLSGRGDYVGYPHTWSNVLNDSLDNIQVINLSLGGRSMASVVSALSTYISINNDHHQYETLVFFQAPDPGRKQLISTKTTQYEVNEAYSPFDAKMEFVKDYNIAGPTNVVAYRGAKDTWDFKGHNEMYATHNMSIGEWYQNIFNAQQICKANNFSFAWTTSTLSFHEMGSNSFDEDEFKNVLDLDLRFDRNVVTLDKTFVSLHFKHLQLAILNMADKGCIMDGTQHFTKETQKLFAGYLANLLLTHEDWWWSK